MPERDSWNMGALVGIVIMNKTSAAVTVTGSWRNWNGSWRTEVPLAAFGVTLNFS